MASNPFIVNENKLERPKNQMIRDNTLIILCLSLINDRAYQYNNHNGVIAPGSQQAYEKWISTLDSNIKGGKANAEVSKKLQDLMKKFRSKEALTQYPSSTLSRVMAYLTTGRYTNNEGSVTGKELWENYTHIDGNNYKDKDAFRASIEIYQRELSYVGVDLSKMIDLSSDKSEKDPKEKEALEAVGYMLERLRSGTFAKCYQFDKKRYNNALPSDYSFFEEHFNLI